MLRVVALWIRVKVISLICFYLRPTGTVSVIHIEKRQSGEERILQRIMNGMLYSLLGRGSSLTTEDNSAFTESNNMVDVSRSSIIWPEDPDDELPMK